MTPSCRQLLSRDESLTLKALCIIIVMMHNYLHLRGYAAENEFQFYADRVEHIWQLVLHPTLELPLHLICFAAPYCLVGFLFISGYGLVKRYEQGNQSIDWWRLAGKHYVKLLRLIALPIAAAYLTYTLLHGHLPMRMWHTLLEVLLVSNLTRDPAIYPFVYWYLGMALQLYVLYALVLRRRTGHYDLWHQLLLIGLVVVCGVAQMCCEPTGEAIRWLRLNAVGYIGPFVLGMVSARHLDHIKLGRWQWAAIALVSGAAMTVSYGYYYTWLWGWLPATLFAVSCIKALPALQCRPLVWLGGVSAMVYLIHPIVREVSLHYKHPDHPVADLVIYMAVTVVIAAGYAWLMQRLPGKRHH